MIEAPIPSVYHKEGKKKKKNSRVPSAIPDTDSRPIIFSYIQSSNTAHWCRTIEEVKGVIHDSMWNYYHDVEVQKHEAHEGYKMKEIHIKVNESVARSALEYLMKDGNAEIVQSQYPGIYTTPEHTLGWMIHAEGYTKNPTPIHVSQTT